MVAGVVVSNLHVRRVLRGVSFDVGEGNVLGVFGPNGSGKTTLLRTIFGSIKPDSGSIRRPQRVGASWQNPYLSFFRKSVWEELLHATGGDVKAADEALRELGFEGLRDSSPFSLSQGQARLLSIRLASLWGPELLLVDEPTTGLDSVEKRATGRYLRSLDTTIIVASHDVGFLREFADEVIVLLGGRIAWRGSPGEAVSRGVMPEWG